jgi:hypothetical protein
MFKVKRVAMAETAQYATRIFGRRVLGLVVEDA